MAALNLRIEESEGNIQRLEREKKKNDCILTYTRWIKETNLLIEKCKEVIDEHKRDIVEYERKRDLLKNPLAEEKK